MLVISAAAQQIQPTSQHQQYSPKAQERIAREVRHQLLKLPYYGGPFDYIAFRLNGYDVVLMGQVISTTLKPDAEKVVRHIEGVEGVINQIETLPPSGADDRLRRALFGAIYGYGPLQKYRMPPTKPIQIIVKNGNVVLEGVVLSKADKSMAGIRANGVPGVFSVTNNLMIEKEAAGM
jgi:hyperosmotically inducible protein